MQFIHLEQRFKGDRINTCMTHHPLTESALMPANSISILYPTSDELRKSPDDPVTLDRARRAPTLYWRLLQCVLAKNDHQVSLDRIEHDPGQGWLIRILGDPATMAMLRSIAAGERQPDGPLALMVRSWNSSLCNE
jgi:hypothetical protein